MRSENVTVGVEPHPVVAVALPNAAGERSVAVHSVLAFAGSLSTGGVCCGASQHAAGRGIEE